MPVVGPFQFESGIPLSVIYAINALATAASAPVDLATGVTGTLPATNGGTGLATYALGDILYASAANTLSKLAGNITTTQKFLSQTGDGVLSDAPSWQPAPASGENNYFFTNTASSIATYLAQTSAVYAPSTPLSTAGLASGATVLHNFATVAGIPNLTQIPAGRWGIMLHARKTAGIKNAVMYAEVWEVSATGVDIALIGTTGNTSILTAVAAEYDVTFFTSSPTMLATTASRLVTRVYASVSGVGTAPTVILDIGGNTDSHTSFPSPTVDATSFVPYIGATANIDLGSHNLTTTGSLVGKAQWTAA